MLVTGIVAVCVSAVLMIVGVTGLWLKVRSERNEAVAERATSEMKLDIMFPWFEQDHEHDSLPGMTRAILVGQEAQDAKLDELTQRLAQHLIAEESEVLDIRHHLASHDTRLTVLESAAADLVGKIDTLIRRSDP